jgi:hypothetical protein
VPFLENGAVKEYPGGFAMITLRQQGFTPTLGPLSSHAFTATRDGRKRPPATAMGPFEEPIASS